MELYALIGVAVITFLVLRKKLTRKESEYAPPVIKPFNPTPVPNGIPDPMDIELLSCIPERPPSPMSTSSDDFVMQDDYIK